MRLIRWCVGLLITLGLTFVLAGCTKSANEVAPSDSAYPVTRGDGSDTYWYTQVAPMEMCFKGVTYVIFAAGLNSSVGSVELDSKGQVVPCASPK